MQRCGRGESPPCTAQCPAMHPPQDPVLCPPPPPTCHLLPRWSPDPGATILSWGTLSGSLPRGARAAGCPPRRRVVASLENPGEPLIFRETSAAVPEKESIHSSLQKCQVFVFFYPFPLQNAYSPPPTQPQRCLMLFFLGNHLKTNRR